jgi:integrase
MQDHENPGPTLPKHIPWNKGKLTGAKPPLRPKHVCSIRPKLQVEGRTRDLAMFNLAIDSKLRGCDVVALKVEDVAPNGYALPRATVRQRKTGRPVRFELTDHTLRRSRTTCELRRGSPASSCSPAVEGRNRA